MLGGLGTYCGGLRRGETAGTPVLGGLRSGETPGGLAAA